MRPLPLRASVTALGCKVNFAEMADLAGALAAAGVEVVGEDEPADVRVLNSCTVTLQADATTRQRLARLRREDPACHLVLCGCSVDGNPERYRPAADGGGPVAPGVDAVFANADKERIADHVIALAAARGAPPSADADAAAALRSRAFVKVQDGCDHRCTYCSVWRARGGVSRSVPLTAALRRVRAAAERHREVVLCGVDLGSWGHEWGLRLADLVTAVLDGCDGVRVRLSSVNADDVDARLAELNAHPRLCAHWHLPLQSGSDSVLRAMHRGYRRRQYLRVVEALRRADPATELTTDIMVGFPGEREADHAATLGIVEDVAFLHCHVFRWSARPGTPAATLPDRVDDATARRRSREVRRAAARTGAARREAAVGSELEVVWERVEGDTARGLSAGYHTVLAVPGSRTRPGGLDRVRAVAVEGEALRATLLRP